MFGILERPGLLSSDSVRQRECPASAWDLIHGAAREAKPTPSATRLHHFEMMGFHWASNPPSNLKLLVDCKAAASTFEFSCAKASVVETECELSTAWRVSSSTCRCNDA